MLSRVITINAKGQWLIFELQDGVAIAPTYSELAIARTHAESKIQENAGSEMQKKVRQYFLLRNIQNQGVTAFSLNPDLASSKVFEKVFPEHLSQMIIQKNQMRSLRTAREIKLHEKERGINPVFINLGKIDQVISPDSKPIKLDPRIPYLWLHNAAGEMILGIEHIWDYVKLCEFQDEICETAEKIKSSIIENYIMRYIEDEEKMKLNNQQLAEKEKEMTLLAKHQTQRALKLFAGNRELHEEISVEPKATKPQLERKPSEDTPTKVKKMLKLRGGLGHASLSPIYEVDGTLKSLEGSAYIAGEFFYAKQQWVLTNQSGRFFSENDTEESNLKLLLADADFLYRRLGEPLKISLAKNKLDPLFLWHKALNVKMEEFQGDKVKIAFNCISKIYKFNSSYTTARKLEKKLNLNHKVTIFNQLFLIESTEITPEERFYSVIIYILDTILPYEKTEAVRVGLVKQIKCMIEDQLSDSIIPERKTALLERMQARAGELHEICEDGTIIIKNVTQDSSALKPFVP